MIFYLSNKKYSVDVQEAFASANKNDYIDDLDAIGIIVRSLSTDTIFDNSKIMIMYNEMKDKITIEIEDTKNDEYIIIKEDNLVITAEERDLITKKLIYEE